LNRPLVVELVGPAGVGKSTLTETLVKNHPGVILGELPNAQYTRFTRFFVEECLKLGPRLLHLNLCAHDRRLKKTEFAQMAILSGGHRVLQASMNSRTGSILLDEGPIHLMTQLLFFGSPVFKNPCACDWWKDIYAAWAKTLDIVILLDADRRQMIERIRGREKWHSIKERTDLESIRYLSEYRSTIEAILCRLSQEIVKPKVLEYNTSTETIEAIETNIINELCT
jgi:deoxyadenosine/deoxycytidine kinase